MLDGLGCPIDEMRLPGSQGRCVTHVTWARGKCLEREDKRATAEKRKGPNGRPERVTDAAEAERAEIGRLGLWRMRDAKLCVWSLNQSSYASLVCQCGVLVRNSMYVVITEYWRSISYTEY